MSTRIVSPSSFVAAATATLITAVIGAALVSSTASVDRDPFQFASIMTANALRVAQLPSRIASACPNNPEAQDHRALVCLRG